MFFTSLQWSVVSKSSTVSICYSYSFEYDEKVKFFMLNNVTTPFFLFLWPSCATCRIWDLFPDQGLDPAPYSGNAES